MRADGRAVPASAAQLGPVLEVVGNAVGRVILSRGAAAVLAPDGSPILPPLVELVAAHRATGEDLSEHRRGEVLLRVVRSPSGLVVGLANEAA